MNIKELIQHADKIPDLGYGGKTVKDDLMFYSSRVKKDRSIVDIAPCFGSTTAYIHCGQEINGRSLISIHSFDLWELQNDEYKHKAKKFCNVDLNSSDDFYNEYLKNIKPYGQTNIYRGDILKQTWNANNKIGLFVDDIGCDYDMTKKIFKIFTDAFIPGETIIFFMDMYFCDSHKGKHFNYQINLIKQNPECFEFIKKVPGSKCAIVRFLNKDINFEVEH